MAQKYACDRTFLLMLVKKTIALHFIYIFVAIPVTARKASLITGIWKSTYVHTAIDHRLVVFVFAMVACYRRVCTVYAISSF